MKRLVKYSPLLRALHSASPSTTKAIIQTGDRGLINTLCDCCHNVLKGNVPLSKVQKTRLRRHKRVLRQLTNKKSLRVKKGLLQTGGFLSALLGPVIGIIGSLLGEKL